VLLLGCGGASTNSDEPGGGTSSDVTDDGANNPDPSDDDDDGAGTSGTGDTQVADADDDDDGAGNGKVDNKADKKPPEVVIKTTETREKMSELLVKPGKKAMKDRKYELAITIYKALVTARGAGSDAAVELATAWTLQGQNFRAVAVYDSYIALVDDPDKLKKAKTERDRLAKNQARFSGRYDFAAATALAKKVFTLGRKAYKKKKWGDAIVYYEMGFALDPDLAGFLRELGAAYNSLKMTDKKIEFYQKYLQERPFGKNADAVRKELKSHKNVLGKLEMSTALDCKEAWVNGQHYGKLTKKKKASLTMAPGSYKALCFAPNYGIAYFEYATVVAGKTAKMTFNWAVVVNKLEKPWGRIVIEDARQQGVMRDLGIDRTEFGIIVPDDGRALKMVLKADDGSKKETRTKRIDPGDEYVVKW
jgi:tetratricopeptide (TPR) repeat protein